MSNCGDEETNTYQTIPQLLNKLLHAGKHIPKVSKLLEDRRCVMCKGPLGIINDTFVILCNAEGFYGKTGFMHGKILLCLDCGFIAEHIDESVLSKVREAQHHESLPSQ